MTPWELPRLSALQSLQVLSIEKATWDSQHSVDDRLMRSWALKASEEEGFPNLRALELVGYSSITRQSLSHLASLPKLILCRFMCCDGSLALQTAQTKDRDSGCWAHATP